MALFASDGAYARVNRETALLLAGPRALLLQLAHPLVAAGVAAHSGFESDPLQRLRRTLDVVLRIAFGSEADARAAAAEVEAVHRRVHGRLRSATRAFPAGTPYDARDPELALWVHATLVDSALLGYESFVAPLDTVAREAYWQESKRMAGFFHVPEALLPGRHADFVAWWEGMLAGPVLEPTPEARRLADVVLHPPLRLVPAWLADVRLPRLAGDAASFLTLALLPAPIRERFGWRLGSAQAAAFGVARAALRRAVPLLPERVRVWPRARAAARAERGQAVP
jgi:uncharacterized protein (DUF2236 family)